MPPPGFKKKELLWPERKHLYFVLESKLNGEDLPRGSFKSLELDLGVGTQTISRTWRQLRQQVLQYLATQINQGVDANTGKRNVVLPDDLFYTKKLNTNNNACKWDHDELKDVILGIPYSLRQTYRELSVEIGVPETTLRRMTKKGIFVRHSNALKPTLEERHKYGRMLYAMDHINPATYNSRHGMKFKDDMDTVYVDEKWFNITRDSCRYILAAGEKKPKRSVVHKSYVAKIMFLCAQARPRMVRGRMWDGKIALLPIGEESLAVRKSANRPRGAPVWKNVKVKTPVYREMMLEIVVKILEKWPNADWNRRLKIKIQQDGAPSHFDAAKDEGWLNGLVELGVADKIEMFEQPPQSPDINICDLGLFRAIDSVYKREAPKDYFDIIDCVQKTYRDYPASKINRMWLTHQGMMNLILETNGDNDFNPPHMNKDKLEREGRLPVVLDVTAIARDHLVGAGLLEDDASASDDDHGSGDDTSADGDLVRRILEDSRNSETEYFLENRAIV